MVFCNDTTIFVTNYTLIFYYNNICLWYTCKMLVFFLNARYDKTILDYYSYAMITFSCFENMWYALRWLFSLYTTMFRTGLSIESPSNKTRTLYYCIVQKTVDPLITKNCHYNAYFLLRYDIDQLTKRINFV